MTSSTVATRRSAATYYAGAGAIVWGFGYHSVFVWAFSLEKVQQYRQELIADWQFSHSPIEAMGGISEVSLSSIGDTDVYVG